ncbi:MAG: 2-dehydropantoate 2-reductase N-terminal domain-containing protein [Dehalococcoidia bacterium]
MRYIIYGAGAVGGTIGARLHDAGRETILIARGDHLAAIRRDGLLLRTPEREIRAHLPAVASPNEVAFRDDDVVLLTMKAHDTSQALDALEVAAGDVPVVCAQNGVANERMAARRFGRVYGLTVLLPSAFIDPGIVDAPGTPVSGVLDLGRFPSGVDALSGQIAADLSASGFVSRPVPDVMRLKYAKLLTNLTNGLDAILGGITPGGGEFGAAMRAEATAVLRSAGIDWAADDEVRERQRSYFVPGSIPGVAGRGGSSTWQSLTKGRDRLEVDFLNGEICLLGMVHGVPTPLNAAVRRLAQKMAAAGERPGARTKADLEALLAGNEPVGRAG